MRYIIIFLLLSGCSNRSFEMEELGEDVIKSGKGVEIEVLPIPKNGGK
jgi:hypothetical protein